MFLIQIASYGLNKMIVTSFFNYGYCIEGKFSGGKVGRIDSFRAFGERKFDELIDQPIDYLL